MDRTLIDADFSSLEKIMIDTKERKLPKIPPISEVGATRRNKIKADVFAMSYSVSAPLQEKYK